MERFGFIVFLIYMGITLYIIPKQSLEFDLYRIKFRLLPSQFKYLSIAGIIVSVFVVFLISKSNENWKEYLVSMINFFLYIFLFSKQREEDEFSQQIRFKALAYSFVYFFAIAGAFGTIDIQNENGSILNKLNLLFLLGSTLLMSLLYFYITLYKVRKS